MRFALAAICLFAVSGCVSPTVTGSSEDTLVVHYAPLTNGPASRARVAQEECARGGREAKFIGIERETPFVEHAAKFECVPKIEAF